jgi:hypothetical protein
MNYLILFLAGVFLCNSIPHAIAGLQGTPFPSPFAKPPGKGNSSPLVNFLWGLFNFLIGLILLSRYSISIGPNPNFLSVIFGALAIGAPMSRHFGKVRQTHSEPKN